MKRLGLGATIIATMIAISVAALPAGAQACNTVDGIAPTSCTVAGSVSMIAAHVVQLQMSPTSTSLAAPTPANFDAGFNATTGPTLTVSANSAWVLHLRASSAFWTATNTSPGAPARTTKPAADLMWSTTSGGTFVALTTSDATLVSGSATATSVTTLFLHTVYAWTLDTPGNYSLAVVLTLTSP